MGKCGFGKLNKLAQVGLGVNWTIIRVTKSLVNLFVIVPHRVLRTLGDTKWRAVVGFHGGFPSS